MKPFAQTLLLLTFGASLSSCISVIKTTKIPTKNLSPASQTTTENDKAVAVINCTPVPTVEKEKNIKGFRYKLPQPYILARPKPDGSITYEPITLPDEDNEYAIHGYAIGANYKLNVTAAKGMLTKVTTTQETNALAKQLLESSASAASTYMQETAKIEKAKEEAEKASLDNVALKELDLQQAIIEKENLPEQASPKEKADANAKVGKAQAALDLAWKQHKKLTAANNIHQSKTQGVPGPVLYRVKYFGDEVKLEAVKFSDPLNKGQNQAQPRFPTSAKIVPPSQTAADKNLKLLSSSLVIDKVENTIKFIVEWKANIEEIKIENIYNNKDPKEEINFSVEDPIKMGEHYYIMKIQSKLSPGEYTIIFEGKEQSLAEKDKHQYIHKQAVIVIK